MILFASIEVKEIAGLRRLFQWPKPRLYYTERCEELSALWTKDAAKIIHISELSPLWRNETRHDVTPTSIEVSHPRAIEFLSTIRAQAWFENFPQQRIVCEELLALLFPIFAFYLLPFVFRRADLFSKLLLDNIPYLVLIINTVMCCYIIRYYVGNITRKTINSLFMGRALPYSRRLSCSMSGTGTGSGNAQKSFPPGDEEQPMNGEKTQKLSWKQIQERKINMVKERGSRVVKINAPLGSTLFNILRQFDMAYTHFKARLGEMDGISHEEGEELMAGRSVSQIVEMDIAQARFGPGACK